MLDAGEVTFGRRLIWALRMRVSISPSGSFMASLSLPARLDHAGDQALARQLAQHVAAHPQLAVVGARTAGDLAPVADPGGRRVTRQLRELQLRGKALLGRALEIAGQLLELL